MTPVQSILETIGYVAIAYTFVWFVAVHVAAWRSPWFYGGFGPWKLIGMLWRNEIRRGYSN